jgi:Tfp pilus assembly protein PilO
MSEKIKLLESRIAALPFFNTPFIQKNRRLIIPGIVLVLAILIVFLVTGPQFLRLFATFQTIQQLNAKKTFYQNKITELQSLDLPKFRDNLETALIALPVDRDITGVTGELLVALSQSGMSLAGVNFASASLESEKVQEYTLTIDVNGTEDNLRNFLERVKLSPRIIKLNTINVSRGKNSAINASIGFAAFYQQLPKNIGTVDEDVPKITEADLKTLEDIKTKIRVLPQASVQTASSSGIGKLDPFRN